MTDEVTQPEVKIVPLCRSLGVEETIMVPDIDGRQIATRIRARTTIGYAPFFVGDRGQLLAWAIYGHDRMNRLDLDYEWPQTAEEAQDLWDNATPVPQTITVTGVNAQMRSIGLEAPAVEDAPEDAA